MSDGFIEGGVNLKSNFLIEEHVRPCSKLDEPLTTFRSGHVTTRLMYYKGENLQHEYFGPSSNLFYLNGSFLVTLGHESSLALS